MTTGLLSSRISRGLGGGLLTGGVLLVSVVSAVLVGSADLAPQTVLASIAGHLGLPAQLPPPLIDSVIWDLRLPRVLMAAAVGAALAMCGCVLQAITGNPLADPYLLGVSSGASTGAVLVFVLGVGGGAISMSAGAFAGALLSLSLVFVLLGRGSTSSTRIVLIGVVVGQLFAALTSLIVTAAGDADAARGILYWLLGSMSTARWDSLGVVATVTAVAGVVFWMGSLTLDGLAFGSESASGLGIDIERVRRQMVLVTALVVASVVAAVGAIGFVGLIVPHAARMLGLSAHRGLLVGSAGIGAIFLIWADAIARSALATEIPVGVVTALIGVPAFLLIMRRHDPREAG
ncbi:FecCD family ABC transporter permease [Dietzia psychralcaliphila]|uniref:FecCD family ABC transporter permease n=1 Tax=Dietzia psychralcaliphila TaxID=139021 RepID=UPI0027DF56ED|nr:iron chelate uptake ABC transporter family permease subunit [Dietzia psychralcaliphila]